MLIIFTIFVVEPTFEINVEPVSRKIVYRQKEK